MTDVSTMHEASVRKGFRVSAKKVDSYLERFKELETSNGTITPEMIVTDALDPASPYHDYFEWDDTAAAKEHRLSQARYLIRSIEVTIIKGSAEQRAYVPVVYKESSADGETMEEAPAYTAIETVMSDPKLRKQYIQKALREAEAFARRYQDIAELEYIIKAVRRTSAKLNKK